MYQSADEKKRFALLACLLLGFVTCQSLFGFDFMGALKDSILDIFKNYVIVIAFLALGVVGGIWVMQGVSIGRVAITILAVGAFIIFAPDLGSWFSDFSDKFKQDYGN